MRGKRLFIIVAMLLLVALGTTGCATTRPAPPEASAHQDESPPGSGNDTSNPLPSRPVERETPAAKPPKRTHPETAEEKAEAELLARAMAEAAGRQSRSDPDYSTADIPGATGSPTNLIPPSSPGPLGAYPSPPTGGQDETRAGYGNPANEPAANTYPVTKPPAPEMSDAQRQLGAQAQAQQALDASSNSGGAPAFDAGSPTNLSPPGSSGLIGTNPSSSTGAVSADKPAEREPSAAEQRAQAQMEAARAQAEAAYRQALAAEQSAQRQMQSADQSTRSSQSTVDFDEAVISGELKKPDAAANPADAQTQSGMGGLTPQGARLENPAANPSTSTKPATQLAPVERYPNIEAPDTVTAGQEIAVQVSLTSEQISPETKILSGVQSAGKLQLQMAEGERQWTLTVNLTVPGMDITRGGTNTAEISIERDSDSGVALFYLRAQPLDAANAAGRRDTRILATLWHNGALLARLSRPLTIVSAAPAASANSAQPTPSVGAAAPSAMARTMIAAAPMHPVATPVPAVQLDPAIMAPDLTIIENRVGNSLRLVFFSATSPPVEADIADPDALHAWINSHFKEMASRGRGITAEPDPAAGAAQLHAQDYLNGFGAELYDKFAPQAFKDLFSRMLAQSPGGFSTIQIYSDDPSLPWELMRPLVATSKQRMDFLGATFSIARWPVTRRGMMRPPQSLMVEQSAVIAPSYEGGKNLQAANLELTTLKKMRGFTEVSGNYAAVRQLAGHPPQGFVHFAGHGAVMDKDGVPQFAILLQDSEMDPATWQGLETAGTTTHPLFFFNACDVGESRQFMNDVDGWAPALLDGGASGYIGALWPVSDTTAELFASTFYDSIAKELALGEHASVAGILMRTREDVFRKTQDPTALAYVFYGDPKLTLAKPQQ